MTLFASDFNKNKKIIIEALPKTPHTWSTLKINLSHQTIICKKKKSSPRKDRSTVEEVTSQDALPLIINPLDNTQFTSE